MKTACSYSPGFFSWAIVSFAAFSMTIIKNNLIPFLHVELSANGEGQRDLTARSDLGKFHEFSLKSYLQDKSYL